MNRKILAVFPAANGSLLRWRSDAFPSRYPTGPGLAPTGRFISVKTCQAGNVRFCPLLKSGDGTKEVLVGQCRGLRGHAYREFIRGPVRIEFALANVTHRKVRVPQVVADIPGREEPKEVVLVGAHLDSWNPGTGAQDNGTGVATLLDVARALKTLPGPPRRTVRFVLFGGEEQGMLGSVAYVRTHRDEMKRLDAVLITDTGAEPAKGWFVMGRKDEGIALGQMGPLLSGLSSDQISQDTSFLFQSDHAAFAVSGVPILMLWTETTKYFSLHHKASDTFDATSKAALLQGEATVAASVYGIADSSAAFAKHLDSGQVENMLGNIGLLSDYRILHDAGLLP